MLGGFFLLLILRDADSSGSFCSYQDVLNYLNLTRANELFSMTRPVKNHTKPTVVYLDLALYAILDVKEIDQTFVPYVWISLSWMNDYISWDPNEFCGINHVTLPTDVLWKPDLTIIEMIEKDNAPQSPHLNIGYDGLVKVKNDQVLVSTCRMRVYKFPFDVQTCSITFKSVVHPVSEIQLVNKPVTVELNQWTKETMRTQYEWLFMSMTVRSEVDEITKQDKIIYTIKMKRRSVLYIINFLLPVLFFLCLDLASFLISDTGGEKLSFKVTVMLAVTVMQLILNDILPSTSNRVPLIAIYYIGVFSLMLISVMETIVVMYLLEKDSTSQDENTGTGSDRRLSEDEDADEEDNLNICNRGKHKWCRRACICDPSAGGSLTKQLKHSCSQRSHHEPPDSQRLSEEATKELMKTLTVLLNGLKEEKKVGYWGKTCKMINKVFFIFYAAAVSLFLVSMYVSW